MDIWIVPRLLPIMNNPRTNIVYKFLYGPMFSFLLGTYLEMELLGHMVTMFDFMSSCQITFPPAVYEGHSFPCSHQDSHMCLVIAILSGVKWFQKE